MFCVESCTLQLSATYSLRKSNLYDMYVYSIYIYTHIAARFSRFSPHLPSSPPAGTSDAPKALSPADLYKLMGNTGSLDDAVPVSDSIVANVIREHQAWHEGFHPAVHPSVHLSFHPSIYLSIDPGIVSIYIDICIYLFLCKKKGRWLT